MKASSILITALIAAISHTALAAQPFITVDDASQDIFPKEWQESPINASADPLPKSDQTVCRKLVERELAKYPARVLEANLKGVYVVSRLRYHDIIAGGTNSRSKVYVVKNDKFTWERFTEYVHAEFSSILLRNHPEFLDRYAWEHTNPDDFSYLGSGVQAIREKKASVYTKESLFEQGFIQQYGMASFEEDFNGYAGRLFMGEASLWEAIEKYPRVKAKADMVIAFYTKLDPSLTFEFFHGMPRLKIK